MADNGVTFIHGSSKGPFFFAIEALFLGSYPDEDQLSLNYLDTSHRTFLTDEFLSMIPSSS
jgi:hypothetical protein